MQPFLQVVVSSLHLVAIKVPNQRDFGNDKIFLLFCFVTEPRTSCETGEKSIDHRFVIVHLPHTLGKIRLHALSELKRVERLAPIDHIDSVIYPKCYFLSATRYKEAKKLPKKLKLTMIWEKNETKIFTFLHLTFIYFLQSTRKFSLRLD
jgi:hypothetical protein